MNSNSRTASTVTPEDKRVHVVLVCIQKKFLWYFCKSRQEVSQETSDSGTFSNTLVELLHHKFHECATSFSYIFGELTRRIGSIFSDSELLQQIEECEKSQ